MFDKLMIEINTTPISLEKRFELAMQCLELYADAKSSVYIDVVTDHCKSCERISLLAQKALKLEANPNPYLDEEGCSIIAPDVTSWKDMAGDNDLEKRLNSYLTDRFIIRYDCPIDECLSESREIIKIVMEEVEKGMNLK